MQEIPFMVPEQAEIPYELVQSDLAAFDHWYLDGAHFVGPDAISLCHASRIAQHGFLWGVEKLSIPTSRGVMWRGSRCGWRYITPDAVTAEEEIREREAKFRQNIVPIIENFDEIWNGFKSELLGLYKPLKEFDLKKAGNMELMKKLQEVEHVGYRMCEIHFYMEYALDGIYMLFGDVCHELFGIDDSSPTFHSLVSGFDNKIFEGDSWLWRLSRRALDLGLGDTFRSYKPEEIAPRLRESDAGRKWLGELDEYLEEFGWKNRITWLYSVPSWREDLSLPIEKIKGYVEAPEFSLPEMRRGLAEERERAVRELTSRVPEDQRGMFNLLLSGAQHAGSWLEDHDFYCEQYYDALLHHYLLEFGRRFATAGTIDDANDIFLLWFREIENIASCPQRYRLQPLIQRRRREWVVMPPAELPPVITKKTFEEAMGYLMLSRDPVAITTVVGKMPIPKPELKADLYGVCGAPGVVEGIARVIMSDAQLHEVRPGDIMVCPTTTVVWTPVFALLSGVVTDRGGSLCHAAIVSREYKIPCIYNTFEATSKIKTGMRIRVDANEEAVYILEGK